MLGHEHYEEAGRLLDMAGRLNPANPSAAEQAKILASGAAVHAQLAATALAALEFTHQYLGDSQEITDWGKAVQPDALTIKAKAEQQRSDDQWPPRRGDIWSDAKYQMWLAVPVRYISAHPQALDGAVYLVCLDKVADDAPDEIREHFGPMRLVSRPSLAEDCPF